MKYHYSPVFSCLKQTVGVLWVVFSLCHFILCLIVLLQQQWLESTATSPGRGFFGPWQRCVYSGYQQGSAEMLCEGSISDWTSAVSTAFSVTRSLTLAATVCSLFSLLYLLLLPCCVSSSTVYRHCSQLQAISGIMLILAVVVFPLGWTAPLVRDVCGPLAARYRPASCLPGWTFCLAVIAAVDALALSIFARQLSVRAVDEQVALVSRQHKRGATAIVADVHRPLSVMHAPGASPSVYNY